MNTKTLILILTILGLPVGFVLAQETAQVQAAVKAIEVGNKICPVSGQEVPTPDEKSVMGDGPVKVEYKGRIYNLCYSMCEEDFEKDPKKYSIIADEEVNGHTSDLP